MVDHVYDKLAEELAELREAPPEERAEELGDLLFVLANLARHYGIDPEAAHCAAPTPSLSVASVTSRTQLKEIRQTARTVRPR